MSGVAGGRLKGTEGTRRREKEIIAMLPKKQKVEGGVT